MRALAGIAMGTAIFAATCAAAANAEDKHIGWIERIEDKCEGRWRENEKSDPRKLSSKDRYQFLYPGESVRCDGSGSMLLQIYDNAPKRISKLDGWYTIQPEMSDCEKESVAGPSSAGSAPLKHRACVVDERALNSFGRAGGRQRGFHSAIFSPAAESTARAGELLLRWNELPGVKWITLRLTDKYHSVLWEQVDADAGLRQLDSPAMRTALVKYREKGGAGPFNLALASEGAEQPAVQFSILTADEEQSLDNDLTNCEKRSGLLRSVCRTYAFTRREMWNNAADEYEAALKLKPDSPDLLLAALNAEMSIGNTSRALELRAQLPAGTAAPE